MEVVLGIPYYKELIAEIEEQQDIDIPQEGKQALIHILDYFKGEGCRPIARLIMNNWEAIEHRIHQEYTEEDWEEPKAISHEVEYVLSPYEVALVLEAFEGPDTESQTIDVVRQLDALKEGQV